MTQLLFTVRTWIESRFRSERGATAIEYGLIAALISVAIIASLGPVGSALSSVFDYIAGQLGVVGS